MHAAVLQVTPSHLATTEVGNYRRDASSKGREPFGPTAPDAAAQGTSRRCLLMLRRSASAEDGMKQCGSYCSSGGLWGAVTLVR